MTITDLLRYIHQELHRVASLGTYDLSREDEYLVRELYGAVQILSRAAEIHHDHALYLIADDLFYAVSHMDLAVHKVESG
jgi:hypothetical protein